MESKKHNLTPFNTLSPERRREISIKGGKARAEQRRRQRREIERIKAEVIARRELAHDEVSMLCAVMRQVKR